MIEIRRSSVYIKWLKKLKDRVGKALIAERISRLQGGNTGKAKSVSGDLSELIIDYGPGCRVYYTRTSQDIILLCGGNKSTQQEDIEKAMMIAKFCKEK